MQHDVPARRFLRLLRFVAAVDVAAVVAYVTLPAAAGTPIGTLLLLALLTALAGLRPVRIRALDVELTATDPFVFCTLAALGPRAAVLVTVAALVGAMLGRRRVPTPICQLFNLGALPLATAIAGHVFAVARPRFLEGMPGTLAALALAVLVYFLANTLLTATVISLNRGRPFLATWWGSGLWTSGSFVTAAILAAAMLWVLETVGAKALVLGLPPVLMLQARFHLQKARVESESIRKKNNNTPLFFSILGDKPKS